MLGSSIHGVCCLLGSSIVMVLEVCVWARLSPTPSRAVIPVQLADPGVKLASKPSSLPVRPRPPSYPRCNLRQKHRISGFGQRVRPAEALGGSGAKVRPALAGPAVVPSLTPLSFSLHTRDEARGLLRPYSTSKEAWYT